MPGSNATTYAHEVRTLECNNCGAPVTGDFAIDHLRCQYCDAVMAVATRPTAQPTDKPKIGQPTTQISEQERIASPDRRCLIQVP